MVGFNAPGAFLAFSNNLPMDEIETKRLTSLSMYQNYLVDFFAIYVYEALLQL